MKRPSPRLQRRTSASADPARSTPLVLYIRGKRQFYGTDVLSQQDLSFLSGVGVRTLQKLENARRLADSVMMLLRISIALNVKIEDLLAPHVEDRLVLEIESRRQALAERKTRRKRR